MSQRWFWLYIKMKFRNVVFVYRLVHQELWQRCISLSVGFYFLLVKGQVCGSQVWYRPYLAAHFGFFDLQTFPWSLSQVQVSTFYPFTPKVGSKCTYIIFTISSVKPSIATTIASQADVLRVSSREETHDETLRTSAWEATTTMAMTVSDVRPWEYVKNFA